jgi:iron complex outermembrane recepter protein
MKARYLMSCAAIAVLSGSLGGVALAADPSAPVATAPSNEAQPLPPSSDVGQIIVTAQRRAEDIGKVPMTVQALTGKTLQQLNIETLDDLLKYTPNVTFGGNGPGQGNIFMRGLSAGAVGNQSSSTIASFPNVAIYLDDQSMSFPSRNEDIYMVDMQRVEVLEGPQGTLFGGGAEAGAIRYITNKPKLDRFEGDAEASYGFTEGGGQNASGNAMLNIPIVQDKLAARVVIYDDHQGGYIDNVYSAFTRSNSDPGNAKYLGGTGAIGGSVANGCLNGMPPGGVPGSLSCTIPTTATYNNAQLVGKDQNPVDYQGARFSVLWQVNPDWDVLITETLQNMDAEGMDADYPTGSDFQPLKPLQVTEFVPSWDKDKLENTAWTINGKVDQLKLVYTGGYSVRNISQQMDYTNYARSVGGIEYTCTGPSSYWSAFNPAGQGSTCYAPYQWWNDQVRSTHLSNEVRISSPDDWRLRFIIGGYQENFRIYDNMNFTYTSIPSCTPALLNPSQYPAGYLQNDLVCIGNLVPAAGSTANDPNVRADGVAFGEDTQRGYDQYAVFGSFDYDIIPHVLTVTAGTRWYEYNEFEVGSQYNQAANPAALGPDQGGTGCVNTLVCGSDTWTNINNEHYKTTYTGFKSRFNLTWNVTDNTMTYFTFSQGFRPGGFNRSDSKTAIVGPNDGSKMFQYPGSYAPDSLTNYEVGLKTALFDHRLLLNLSAYYMQWDNVQFFLFDPPAKITSTFGMNGPSYNVEGAEFQIVGRVTDNLTVFASGSYNDDTVSQAPCLKGNIPGSAYYNECILTYTNHSTGITGPFPSPFGVVGDVPAFSPKFEGNIRLRYDFEIKEYRGFFQIGGNYVGGMWNQPASYELGNGSVALLNSEGIPVTPNGVPIPTTVNLRYYQPAYGTIDASIGIAKDNWHMELYGTNLTNSHASTFTSSAQFIKSEVPLRPLVVGLKVGANF